MEGNKAGAKYPAPSFSTENEPFYDLLKTGNNPNNPSTTSSTQPNMVDFGENILPSYDFHPTRPAPPLGGTKIMSPSLSEQSLDGKASIDIDSLRPKTQQNASEGHDENTVAAVERTMKKYADNLMRVLEDMGGKLTQLERTTDRLESAVSELQSRSADQHGEMDGRVRGLEHVLREVQRGVQLLRDKSELAEAQAELAKMQMAAKPSAAAPASSALVPAPQTFPALTAPPAASEEPPKPVIPTQPQPQVEQQAPAPPTLATAPSAPPQQLSVGPSQFQPPPQPQPQGPPQQPQQPPSYSQPPPYITQQPPASAPPPPPPPQQPQQPQVHNPPPPQFGPQQMAYMQRPPPPQQQDAPAYLPQGYGQQAGAPPQQMSPPPPQQQGPPRQGYEGPPPQGPLRQGFEGPPPQGPPHPGGRLALPPPPGSYPPPPQQGYADRPVSGGGYDRPPSASYERPPPPGYERQPPPSPVYDRPPQGYERQSGYEPRVPASPYGPPQYAPGGAPPAPGSYPRLQMAQPVQSSEPPPRAAPAGGGAQMSTSKMPIDQVIDDVAAMGFHKDEVRGIVRQLTETGKSVDLNIVLDTLMTRGGGSAPPSKGGWYGR